MFNPPTEYDVTFERFKLKDFWEYSEEYVVRPPYQRKNVWSRNKKQALLDSLFRRFYVPRIVLREIRLEKTRTKMEVIDGQQRILTAQEFFDGSLKLPKTLRDLDPDLPGATYSDLAVDKRKFVDKRLQYDVDLVKNISDPWNPDHQRVAAEIFWRLQQGEKLNYMEEAHGRLSSLPRNFVVKYADDISFNYEQYEPIDTNPHKHHFFDVIHRRNNRMQHLALLSRLLILEENDGIADINNKAVIDFIESGQVENGIGRLDYENTKAAKNTLSHMNSFFKVFRDDDLVVSGTGMREFRTEYFTISIYLLLRHLNNYYVFKTEEQRLFYEFVIDFSQRHQARREDDNAMLVFSDHRQQTAADIEIRQRILRQMFFEYTEDRDVSILAKDTKRRFSEAERIALYRRDNGLCQICLSTGLSEEEAKVPWSRYEADHVLPHSGGGETDLSNAQVLCERHNREKSDILTSG